VFEPEPGKFHALNRVLETIETPLVVTVDADTYRYPASLGYLAARVTEDPQDEHVCACAGAIVVENAHANFLTRMQQWDYRLGINGIKRMQAAYNSALVAEGAFSAYWTEDVRAVGGWPDAIGEDIVLTWTMMDRRGVVLYEPLALASTTVPVELGHFMRQRSRWARGMFEGPGKPTASPTAGARQTGGRHRLPRPVPGSRLPLLLGSRADPRHPRYPLILSRWSMLLIPISLVIYHALSRWQEHHVFRAHHIDLPADRRGFWGYVLPYHALSSTASIRGYTQYIAGAKRRWR
jgi:poly-beta-1,6-N-acetyl-D-glucosamine synthase